MHKNHYLKEKDTEIGAEKHNTFLTGVFFYIIIIIIIIDGLTVRLWKADDTIICISHEVESEQNCRKER
jgi:hypothetical protein